ncbi:4-hydroxyphenylacetate 3-hydroxylase N-terminal domain-containing protein [Streptomyces cyaneofuscatus]|uniref:4-hydroxyphenylacetate 3-hydroxylase N-terminal domain-containing protein n=1 Tax=Streptomyces cyaneofuscatus TaxID=66883 RepID=UPI003F575725
MAEAAPAIRPMGAGVNLLPNVRELHALGLHDSVAAGFVSAPDVFAGAEFDGRADLDAYYRRMTQGRLYQSFPITNPQIDRTKSAAEQEEDDLFVRVVKELDGGIVVRGAKMIGTAAVFGDEITVGTIEPPAPQDVEYALCFSVPVNTPGLKFISRTSYEASARSVFDNPLSSRFDENDALLVCDGVFVPWENVLTYRNVESTFGMWWLTPAYNNFVHQAATRFWTKREFLTGLAILYDLTHPELGPLLAKYVRSPGHPAEQRIKLMKLAWDALGSEFASRHEQYERFVRDGNPDLLAAFTQSCLDGYQLDEQPFMERGTADGSA